MKQNSSTEKSKNRGFTLVELIVVIAILAILSAVGAVAYTGYIEHTKKGLDKQTVGEIMHALELADYADSSLFGENGGAMVVISTDKTDAAGLNNENTAALKNALEDALGEGGLASTKLSYGKWSGTANMKVFAGLGLDGSQIAEYTKNLKDPTKGVSAAFAEDMEEYWDGFKTLITMINSGAVPEIQSKIGEGDKNSIVKLIVDHYNAEGFDDNTVISTWKNRATDPSLSGMALNLATKHSFVSYAKRQPSISPEAQKVLEDYMAEYQFKTDDKFMELGWCTDTDVKAELETLAKKYVTSQAEADARAYLGLMEAAAEAQKNLGDTYSDDDFLAELDPYVPMVSNVLTGKTDLSIIKELAAKATGSVVIINVKKVNGALVWDENSVSPIEANPRDGSGNDAPQEVAYTKDGSSLTLTGDNPYSGEVIMAPNSTITVTVNQLPPNGETYSVSGGVTSAGRSENGIKIIVGESGGTIAVTWGNPYRPNGGGTITLNVIVK